VWCEWNTCVHTGSYLYMRTGYEAVDPRDRRQGCKPKFQTRCDERQNITLVKILNSDFLGNEQEISHIVSLSTCENICCFLLRGHGFQPAPPRPAPSSSPCAIAAVFTPSPSSSPHAGTLTSLLSACGSPLPASSISIYDLDDHSYLSIYIVYL
jgi:hypothetical protein